MSELKLDNLEPLAGFPATRSPGPPSAALLASLGSLKPVRTRIPMRTLAIVAAAGCVFPVYAFSAFPLRKDLSALPVAWVVVMALLWLTGFVMPLVLALIPRRGQVLPNGTSAGRAAVLAATTLTMVGLLFTIDAPGRTILPSHTWAGFWDLWWHCVSFGFKVSVPLVFVAAILLRRVAVISPVRLGAAVGAAGGALAGLTLHGLCPFGGAAHVGLAHGGGVVLGALIGAIWLPLLVRVGDTPS